MHLLKVTKQVNDLARARTQSSDSHYRTLLHHHLEGTFQRGGIWFNLSREHSPATRDRPPEAEGKSITDSEERIRGIDHQLRHGS